MSLAAETRLGPYAIASTLGEGGMGVVYRGTDTRLGREVAIKVLPIAAAASPDALARFEREGRAIASLNHPNICTLFDVGTDGGHPYLVMELLSGASLHQALEAGPLPVGALIEAISSRSVSCSTRWRLSLRGEAVDATARNRVWSSSS